MSEDQPAFNQSDWAEEEDMAADAFGDRADDTSVGLVISTAATRVSVWDGPWEELGTTASASAAGGEGFAGTCTFSIRC